MTTGAQLLQSLGSVVRPDCAACAPNAPSVEGLDFASLLSKADAGALSSGRSIKLGKNANVSLTDAQLQRLAKAADTAEASGAKRLLALIDGQGVVIDLASRTVEGSLGATSAAGVGGVLTGIDAAIVVPPDGGDAAAPGAPLVGAPGASPVPLPSVTQIANRSLAELLATLGAGAGR